ncbi:hypothetical protein [Tenacibaculum sp. M341]|uniref:hypothetical protein n=1 Tax=Tenacibaculum sp. M341 TaxID=2530339 RepID=UPI00104A0740|nr:hypothetical protein [Tenacibaculum sp. M341]TCI95088.1 hypothetical protein EYW44_01830 [Tenacibaculum sp. M341]
MDIKSQITKVLQHYPELHFNQQKNTLEGTLEIDTNDFYTLLIDLTPWNKHFPRVYELGERIPNSIDRHVYEAGNCCFTTPRLEEILLKTKIKTIAQFMQHILIPYLQNNSYYELHKHYINGEFSHSNSTQETYQTLLDTTDNVLILKVLFEYIKGNKLSHKDRCYCGSGKTLRKCANGNHKRGYDMLQYIDIIHLKKDVLILNNELEEILKAH